MSVSRPSGVGAFAVGEGAAIELVGRVERQAVDDAQRLGELEAREPLLAVGAQIVERRRVGRIARDDDPDADLSHDRVGPRDDRDLGDLYARLISTADAAGVYHATDGGAETVNEIVAALAEHAPTEPSIRRVPLAEARKKMGPYADALALDQIVRSPRARALGWSPTLHSVSGNAARLFEEWRRGKAA